MNFSNELTRPQTTKYLRSVNLQRMSECVCVFMEKQS